MGDRKTLAMARKELEEMYVGIPDDSVNLSFQDLAQVMHNKLPPSSTMQPISESAHSAPTTPPALSKLPSLDFTRALNQASLHHHHHHQRAVSGSPAAMEHRSFTYDDMNHVSAMSSGQEIRANRRRRPGTPHSNICTVCSTYIYIFRHRCMLGLWESLLQAVCCNRNGRDEGRKKMHGLFRQKIQPKIHQQSRKCRLLFRISICSQTARAQVGRERPADDPRTRLPPRWRRGPVIYNHRNTNQHPPFITLFTK